MEDIVQIWIAKKVHELLTLYRIGSHSNELTKQAIIHILNYGKHG
jgi:hypothetical protein